MTHRQVLPPDLVRVAVAQHGLLSAAQVSERFGRSAGETLLGTGVLRRVESGVYALAGSEATFRRRAMAGALAYGPPVAVSHLSAGVLWRMPVHSEGIQVTVPRQRSGRRGGGPVTHRSTLPGHDVVDRYGIPVTTPVRTMLDLAAISGPPTGPLADSLLIGCVDHLLGQRSVTVAALRTGLDGHRHHGGHSRLCAVLNGYGVDTGCPADSAFEVRVWRWLVGAGLPEPVRQHQVDTEAGPVLLDMAYPRWLVAVEFDGWSFHGGRGAFDRDRRRRNQLAALGWAVVAVTSRHGEKETVAVVEEVLRSRSWRPEPRSGG